MRIVLVLAISILAACPRPTATAFPCNDSQKRADGTQRTSTCTTTAEYCYEGSGGAAISHGAQCKKLPKPDATCADIEMLPGASCSGTPQEGLRVRMVFP